VIPNLVGPAWERPEAETLPVYNPATGEVIEQVPLSGPAEVDAAVGAALAAYRGWSRTPLMERVRLMFRFKALLDEHADELAAIVTRHHGKTLDEAAGEVRRGVDPPPGALLGGQGDRGDRVHPPATGPDQPDRLLGHLRVQVTAHHVGTLPRAEQRRRPPDPAAGARDERPLAVQPALRTLRSHCKIVTSIE